MPCVRRALFKTSLPANGSEPARDQFYVLAPGQRDGAIELVDIDEKNASVRIRISGEPMVLTFEKNGMEAVDPPPRILNQGPR